MDNLIHKRSVSFASVIVDSMGNAKAPSNKLVEQAKKAGRSSSYRADVNNNGSEVPVHPQVPRVMYFIFLYHRCPRPVRSRPFMIEPIPPLGFICLE